MAGGDVPERATPTNDDVAAGTERWQPMRTAAERALTDDDTEVRRLAGLILADMEQSRQSREATAAEPEPARPRWTIKRIRRHREVYAPFPSDRRPQPEAELPPSPPPTDAPTAAPTEPPASPQPIVHPGAYCAPAGATGVTAAGTPMVCGPESDGRNRWHAA